MCCSGFSNEFDESDYFTFKPQVLQHIDFAAEDELASEPDYSHFIRMANYNDLVITRGHHDTTDSRETIFLGSLQLFHARTICSRYGVVVGCVDSNAFPALAERYCSTICAAFFAFGAGSGFHGGSFPSPPYSFNYTDNWLCHRGTYSVPVFFGYLNPYNLAVLALIFGIVTSIDGPSMHSMR